MPEWLTIILALGGSALITGLVGFILQRTLYKKADERDRKKAAAEAEEIAEKQELEVLRDEKIRKERVSDLQEAIKPISDKIDKIDAKLGATAEGTLASLRNDILTLYYKCCEKGYRNDYDYLNIHDMYDAYQELDGNSFIADIMDRFDRLPVKENTVPTKVISRSSTRKSKTEEKELVDAE